MGAIKLRKEIVMIKGFMVGLPLTLTAIVTYIITGDLPALMNMVKLTIAAIVQLF